MAFSLIEGLAELLWPTRCVICDQPGTLLCPECRQALPWIDRQQACLRCGVPFGVYLCVDCGRRHLDGREPFAFSQARSALELTPASRQLVTSFKDGGERRMSGILAGFLASAIPRPWIGWSDFFTYIPADKEALRRRDFDHMALIAQEMEGLMDLPCLPILKKGRASDQRTLGRAQRQENTREAFALLRGGEERVQGAQILLVDDVMTSGATLDAASALLLAAGAADIRVATILRAW